MLCVPPDPLEQVGNADVPTIDEAANVARRVDPGDRAPRRSQSAMQRASGLCVAVRHARALPPASTTRRRISTSSGHTVRRSLMVYSLQRGGRAGSSRDLPRRAASVGHSVLQRSPGHRRSDRGRSRRVGRDLGMRPRADRVSQAVRRRRRLRHRGPGWQNRCARPHTGGSSPVAGPASPLATPHGHACGARVCGTRLGWRQLRRRGS